MRDISIELYKKEHQPQFVEYIRNAFHKKHIFGDPKYIDWQYGGNLFIAISGNKIIGHFGFRDLTYKMHDSSKSFRVLMNFFVSESYHMSGAAVLLAKKVFETKNQVVVLRYKPAAQNLFSRIDPGWRDLGNFKRYLAILDASSPFFGDYGLPPANNSKKFIDGGVIVDDAIFDKSFEQLWQSVRSRYPVTVERTFNYLSWRFKDHPFFQYKLLTAKKNGELKGYLVWKMEGGGDLKIASIIDFISTDDAEHALLKVFLDRARKEGAAAADFLFSGNFYNESLIESGFFDVKGTNFENFPTLFNPISYAKPFVNVGCNFETSFDNCYFTKADGDRDRPNPH